MNLFLALLVAVSATPRRFDGDKVLRCSFDFSNFNHRSLYDTLLDENRDEVDIWTRGDIHLTPQSFPRISSALQAHNVPCQILIENVQDLVDAEQAYSKSIREKPRASNIVNGPNPDPFFDDYHTFDDINDWCKNLSVKFSSFIRLEQLNTTYEGRPIIVLKVAANGDFGKKPVIFYEGGIHAREWIAHATMTYLLGKLSNASDPDVVSILSKFEVHIVPIVNGDGYVWTWTNDRMWRKTRKPNQGSPCIGTDPNRNWDDHWCQIGASTQPCSDSYCGSAAFTEREVLSMANHVISTQKTQPVKVFIDWHSYGQLWMAPYGWSNATPPDAATQATIGNAAVNAIKPLYGSTFTYGMIYTIIYPASGSSADYGYDEQNVTYSYGVELRDTGTYGFLLPADQIRPQGEEIWAATVAMAKQIPL